MHGGRPRPGIRVACDCGGTKVLRPNNLTNGKTSSCGCLKHQMMSERRLRHGESSWFGATKEYQLWKAMRQRCENPKHIAYPHYGGRGIRVFSAWRKSFKAFLADVGRAPSPQHSIDRINVDGHYEPGNVRWATSSEQARNRTTTRRIEWAGASRTPAEWDAVLGLRRGTTAQRLRIGWTVERTLTTPALPLFGRTG